MGEPMFGEASFPFLISVSRQCIKVNLIKTYNAVQELWAFSLRELDQAKWCSVKPRHRFAYHWPYITTIYMFIQNLNEIYRVVQELWAFSLKKRSTSENVARWSLVTVLHTSASTMLKFISLQNFNQMHHAVQEEWAFSIKELTQPKCSVKLRHRFKTSGWTRLKYISIQNLNQIYHAFEEVWAFSLKRAQPAKLMLVEALSSFSIHVPVAI